MPRRVLQGRVVSDKMDKTISVRVERQFMHPVYKKYVRKSKKYLAHVEGDKPAVGTMVQIIEASPVSKNKRWRLVDDVETAAGGAAGA